MEQKATVFFDESGKKANELSLMGALLIPNDFYKSAKIQHINHRLRQREFSLHFTKLTHSNEKDHFLVLKTFLEYQNILKFNVVSFQRNKHFHGHHLESNSNLVQKMIYSKIPERVLYGVLRDFGNFTILNADIFIEECTQYKEYELHKKVKEQLNVHALYRYENYSIDNSRLYPKNKEIGIELTDTLLGILRIVIENEDVTRKNGENSKTLWRKKKFIYRNRELLEQFFRKTNYFELSGHSTLEKRDLIPYFSLFLSKYMRELEEYEALKE